MKYKKGAEYYYFKNKRLRAKSLTITIILFVFYFLASIIIAFGIFNFQRKIIIKNNVKMAYKDRLIRNYLCQVLQDNGQDQKEKVNYFLNNFKLSKYKKIYKKFGYPVNSDTSFMAYWSSEYGYRTIEGWYHYHQGNDITPTSEVTTISVSDGYVITADFDRYWGNYVFVKYVEDDEEWIFLYAHLESILVLENKEVEKGDVIGIIGGTGNNGRGFPIHLHFGAYKRLNDGHYYSMQYFSNSVHGKRRQKVRIEERLLYDYLVKNL